MSTHKKVGRWGESLAAKYLQDNGYEIIERNVHTPHGEIDLIARQEYSESSTIVFVEVKTRRSRTFGLPEDSVDLRKRAHLLAAAEYYMQQHPDLVGDWRLDVIAIQHYRRDQPPEVTHFENAIS